MAAVLLIGLLAVRSRLLPATDLPYTLTNEPLLRRVAQLPFVDDAISAGGSAAGQRSNGSRG